MKLKTAAAALPLLVLTLAPVSGATKGSDRSVDFPIAPAMEDKNLQEILPAGVKYFFADQPAVAEKELGHIYSHRKSPVIYIGPEKSCRRAFISGLVALGESAKAQGGNAVIGIQSNYDGQVLTSRDRFRCGVGMRLVGVGLTGKAAVVP
ncbi:MAG TPA: hypothetical protein VEA44_15930 [Caulobacter sp.]|nr:hypothetical protein [Caulobacter sp.]